MSNSGTPWTEAYQAPSSMGFSRQEYWSGVPLPSPKHVQRSHYYCTHYSFTVVGFCILFFSKNFYLALTSKQLQV